MAYFPPSCSLWAFMMNFSSLLVPQCIWTIAILGELTQTCLLLHLFRNVLHYVLCIHRDDNVFIWDHFQLWFWSIDISGSWLKRKHSKGHGCFVNAYNSLYCWEVEIWEKKIGNLSLKIVFVLELMSCNFHVLSKSWKVSVMGGEMFGWWCECFWTLKLFLL